MTTAVFYDKNSADSLLAALVYKYYINFASANQDIFVPFDGFNLTEVIVDPQTALAFDRYLFLEVPPDAGSLATLMTNNKEVVLFSYTAPTDWTQSLGATIIPLGLNSTIASTFMNWLFTVVDSSSFFTFCNAGLPQLINDWEFYCRTYLNPSIRDQFRNAANYAWFLLKTGLNVSLEDLKAQFIGFMAYSNFLSDASIAYSKSYSMQVVDGENTYNIYRLPMDDGSIQPCDRPLTQNYFSAYVANPNTFIEYYEAVADLNGSPIMSVTIKPIGFLASPLFYRDSQFLTDLVGTEQIAKVAAILADYYAALGGGASQVTNEKQNWDGTFSFNLPTSLYLLPITQ
jgi:hypothetical protein